MWVRSIERAWSGALRLQNRFTVVGVTLAVLAMSGCYPKLMPTPVIFSEDHLDPTANVSEEDADVVANVFIATNRARASQPDGSPRMYSNARDPEGILYLAKAKVRFGKDDSTWDDVREVARSSPRGSKSLLRVTSVHEYGRLWTSGGRPDEPRVRNRVPMFEAHLGDPVPEHRAATDAFLADVDAALERSQSKNIYIFVHGFKTSFASNTTYAASLWHYLGRDGVVISFAWPSRNSIFAYAEDKASARASELNFRLLLLMLNQESKAERINILAHSAGASLVVNALKELRLMYFQSKSEAIVEGSNISQVVLAAPDMDIMRFSNSLYDAFDQVPELVTIYISTQDSALGLAEGINGFARLGNPIEVLQPRDLAILRKSDTISVVDVAEARRKHSDLLGHGYYNSNPWVSSDILLLLRFGAAPEDRGLYMDPNGAFWLFPHDYDEIGPQHARRLFESVGNIEDSLRDSTRPR